MLNFVEWYLIFSDSAMSFFSIVISTFNDIDTDLHAFYHVFCLLIVWVMSTMAFCVIYQMII